MTTRALDHSSVVTGKTVLKESIASLAFGFSLTLVAAATLGFIGRSKV